MVSAGRRDVTGISYEDFKRELDTELSKAAEGFVKIGYMLKVARDTDVLSGRYGSVNEFAQAEYGIDKTTVSRWIRINDRFSEGGCSDRLRDEYQGFGYAKLSLMLSLPDAINEALTPSYSKAEIQQIKDESDAEKQVTDIESYIDELEHPQTEGHLAAFVRELLKSDEEYVRAVFDKCSIADVIAPQGDGYVSARVSGLGRLAMTIKDGQTDVKLTNLRTGEAETYSLSGMENTAADIVNSASGSSPHAKWCSLTGRSEPEKPRGAGESPKKKPVRVHKVEDKAEKPVQNHQSDGIPQNESTEALHRVEMQSEDNLGDAREEVKNSTILSNELENDKVAPVQPNMVLVLAVISDLKAAAEKKEWKDAHKYLAWLKKNIPEEADDGE